MQDAERIRDPDAKARRTGSSRWVRQDPGAAQVQQWFATESRRGPLYLVGFLGPPRLHLSTTPDPSPLLRHVQDHVVQSLGEDAAPWPLHRCPLRFRGRLPEREVLVLLEVRGGAVTREHWLPFHPGTLGETARLVCRQLARWREGADGCRASWRGPGDPDR